MIDKLFSESKGVLNMYRGVRWNIYMFLISKLTKPSITLVLAA